MKRLPPDDELLPAAEAARICAVPESRWGDYWRRWPSLRNGSRVVRGSNPDGAGVRRWLRSACIEHMHRELLQELEVA